MNIQDFEFLVSTTNLLKCCCEEIIRDHVPARGIVVTKHIKPSDPPKAG